MARTHLEKLKQGNFATVKYPGMRVAPWSELTCQHIPLLPPAFKLRLLAPYSLAVPHLTFFSAQKAVSDHAGVL